MKTIIALAVAALLVYAFRLYALGQYGEALGWALFGGIPLLVMLAVLILTEPSKPPKLTKKQLERLYQIFRRNGHNDDHQ